jgi:hypothetical protein
MVAMYSKKMKVELVEIAVKPYPYNILLLSYFYKVDISQVPDLSYLIRKCRVLWLLKHSLYYANKPEK